ncbi:MAG: adenylyltransferase and sulfurtransferase [bacterium]|nr:MAG: adenylyltransferase and sulfurtransferase [bacterium]
MIIGLGGLGAPVGLYLAAAGIGRLGLVDFDVVDLTNLQRQIMYGTKDIGQSKLEVTKQRLTDLNPKIEIETYQTGITRENAIRIFQNYDVIVDGTDNFATRYLVNDVCVMLGKPNVYGSIFRFDGQASVFFAEKGPCYRCVYPEPPPQEFVPSCAEGGVLGILPATIGSIQATETIKLILGKGDSLIGRLLVFDALKMKFKELKIHKNINCAICGEKPTITGLIDYKEFCGVPNEDRGNTSHSNHSNLVAGDYEITPQELKEKFDKSQDILVLDVRELAEYEICRIPNATLVPIGELFEKLTELDKNTEIVVYCKLGIRTSRAIHMLRDAGFNKAKGLIGGINLWAQKIDTDMPRY